MEKGRCLQQQAPAFSVIGGNYHDTCIEKQCGPEKSGRTEKTADEYINKSLSSLDIFEDNDYRKALIALALAMVGRTA